MLLKIFGTAAIISGAIFIITLIFIKFIGDGICTNEVLSGVFSLMLLSSFGICVFSIVGLSICAIWS